MLVTMLIMMLPRADEAPPVEAAPMAAARVHEDHVVSSASHEHHAAVWSIMILRMTSAAAASVLRLCCARAELRDSTARQRDHAR